MNEDPEEQSSGAPRVLAVPSKGFNYYTDVIYYNSFEQYLSIQNEQISGDENLFWLPYFTKKYGTFERALFINCGNGWVERSMFSANVVKNVVGIDIDESSLATAINEAAKIGMPCEYICMNINEFQADTNIKFDLVVNYGAMHHVAYVNKLTMQLRNSLSSDGMYLLMDYVGPHRNQYPWWLWERVVEINEQLPKKFRALLSYPHVETMLSLDPTEAIHSDLQIDVLQRYFNIEEYKPLGGGLCHILMYQHTTLFEARHSPEGKKLVEFIFTEDRKLLHDMPESNLFSFAVARPKKPQASNPSLLEKWQEEEDIREKFALENGGRYYPITALEIIYNELTGIKYQLAILTGRREKLIRHTPPAPTTADDPANFAETAAQVASVRSELNALERALRRRG